MSPLLGVVDRERIQLNALGMSEVPAAAPLLEAWASIVRSACKKERHERRITGDEMLAACNGDRALFPCVVAMMMKEPWPEICGMGSSNAGFWIRWEDDVLAAREASTVAEILELRGPSVSGPQPSILDL